MNASPSAKYPHDVPIDTDIVARAINGNPDAFAAIYTASRPAVRRVIAVRMQGAVRNNIDDLVSEVFIRAWRNIGRFQQRDTDIRGWLCVIALNLVRDFHKSHDRRIVLFDQMADGDPDPAPGPEEVVTDRLESQRVRAEVQSHVANLTPDQRHCLALRFGREASIRETAQLLSRSGTAIKALQHRAQRSLEQAMADQVTVDAGGATQVRTCRRSSPKTE